MKTPNNNRPYGSTIICETCGKEYVRTRGTNQASKKYCSMNCEREAARLQRLEKIREENKGKETQQRIKIEPCPVVAICQVCGKEYTYNYKGGNRKYCSDECKKKNAKEMNTESEEEVDGVVRYLIAKMNQATSQDAYTPVFFTDVLNPTEAQERSTLARDKRRCRVCNSRTGLEIHHIIKRRDGGTNDLDNLITLCRKCHRHIETGDVEHALEKCKNNYNRIKNGESSIFANHLNNLEKVEYAYGELNKLYAILASSGEDVKTESVKVCIDDVLDHLEQDS